MSACSGLTPTVSVTLLHRHNLCYCYDHIAGYFSGVSTTENHVHIEGWRESLLGEMCLLDRQKTVPRWRGRGKSSNALLQRRSSRCLGWKMAGIISRCT